MTEGSSEKLRERLLSLVGAHVPDAEVIKLLNELIGCGGGVMLELDEIRFRLIRREGRFMLKKEDLRRSSSIPPRASRRATIEPER